MSNEAETIKFIPVIALILSLISLLISIVSFRRTKIFQDYDYAPRLQIADERVVGGSPSVSDSPAIIYMATLENRSSKPIKIDGVYLDYGDRTDSQKRIKYSIKGEMFLSPGKTQKVKKEITWESVEDMKKKFSIDHCQFFFRVIYHSAKNELHETSRPLYRVGPDGCIFNAHKGDALT